MIHEQKNCPYRGHMYSVPSLANNDATARLSVLKLSVNSQCITSSEHVSRIFVDKEVGEQALSLSLSLGSCDFMCEQDEAEVIFCLYREEQPEPILQLKTAIADFGEYVWNMTLEAGNWTYGKYFLVAVGLVENSLGCTFDKMSGFVCLPFTVFPAGGTAGRSVPVEASLIRVFRAETEPLFASEVMKLKLRFSETVAPNSCFEVHCYTSEWKLMAVTERFIPASRTNFKRVSFRLNPDKIWLAGDYWAVVSHNREPYALLRFRYEGMSVTVCECRPLAATEDEYWVVKQLERDEENKWEYIREFNGLSEVVPRLVRLSRMNGFNSLCKEHGVSELQLNSCMLITASSLFECRRLAFLLPKFLDLNVSSRIQIDCAKTEKWEVNAVDEAFKNREEKLLVFYHIGALTTEEGSELLGKLKEALANRAVFSVFILCGTDSEVEELRRFAPELFVRFTEEGRFVIRPFSWQEVVYSFRSAVGETSLRLSPQAEHELVSQVRRLWEYNVFASWSHQDADAFLSGSLIPSVQKRLQEAYCESGIMDADEFTVVQPCDVRLSEHFNVQLASVSTDVETSVENIRQRFEESMLPIYNMIGLNTLKQELEAVFYQVCFNRQRKLLHLPSDDEGTYHMIFTGNPGTGKTTVAQYIGKIFHAMGLLSKGEVVMTERSKLVGRYIGETEKNMQDVLESARGNVLFIDEAYTLCDTLDDRKDFGNHVVESLLTVLSQPHSDMLVILAGYENEMERLMQMNQGLQGRFPYRFHFDDYSADELMQIARHFLAGRGYSLEADAETLLNEVVRETLDGKDRYFDNARWIKKFFTSGVFPAMAMRVMKEKRLQTDATCLQCIRKEDIAYAAARFRKQKSPVLVPRRRIGFIA